MNIFPHISIIINALLKHKFLFSFRNNMLTSPGNSKDLRDVIDVNVMALCYCTREAFNSMKDRDVAGHIIHINRLINCFNKIMIFINIFLVFYNN